MILGMRLRVEADGCRLKGLAITSGVRGEQFLRVHSHVCFVRDLSIFADAWIPGRRSHERRIAPCMTQRSAERFLKGDVFRKWQRFAFAFPRQTTRSLSISCKRASTLHPISQVKAAACRVAVFLERLLLGQQSIDETHLQGRFACDAIPCLRTNVG